VGDWEIKILAGVLRVTVSSLLMRRSRRRETIQAPLAQKRVVKLSGADPAGAGSPSPEYL